jgi:hypothetical protein
MSALPLIAAEQRTFQEVRVVPDSDVLHTSANGVALCDLLPGLIS